MRVARSSLLVRTPRAPAGLILVPSWQLRTPTRPTKAPPPRTAPSIHSSASPASSQPPDTPSDTASSDTDAPASAHPAGAPERCFALETISEDGQAWVRGELGAKLVGLAHATPRAACRTTQLLGYHGNMLEGEKALRCDQLDLDLGWEAECKGLEGSKFTGQAKVTMGLRDKDEVAVAVAVDPECVRRLPQGREGALRDVVYAVESLDTAIMEQLNDFLWSMEAHNERQLAAGEATEGGEEEGGGRQEVEAKRAA